MLPLEGYRVLDLSRQMPGPYATHLLADLGMEVIKVEEPLPRYGMGRDDLMPSDPTAEEEVVYAAYNAFARNKKSIALQLLKPEIRPQAQEVFYKLAQKADIVVESYRPGVTKWMGVDYDTVKQHNPRIIYCAVTGYGQTGPYVKYAGHGGHFSAVSGTASRLRDAEGIPLRPDYTPIGYLAALYAVTGILSALVLRDRTGQGQFIDVSLTGADVTQLFMASASYFRTGQEQRRVEGPRLDYVKCKDGKWVTISNPETYFWENFCRVLGHEEWIPLRRGSGPDFERMVEEVKAIFLTKTRDEWLKTLREADCCIAPLNELPEALEDPQVLHLGMVWEAQHPSAGKVKQMGVPIRFSDVSLGIRELAPELGKHTVQVMRELGYSDRQIQEQIPPPSWPGRGTRGGWLIGPKTWTGQDFIRSCEFWR
ncbi:MAG: CoA transferase [Chloroflexi bacterium]|nr:CoA transferase [Chloroflexota bacterium]